MEKDSLPKLTEEIFYGLGAEIKRGNILQYAHETVLANLDKTNPIAANVIRNSGEVARKRTLDYLVREGSARDTAIKGSESARDEAIIAASLLYALLNAQGQSNELNKDLAG